MLSTTTNKFASESGVVSPENNPFEMLAVPSEHVQRLLFSLCSRDAHVRQEAREAVLKALQPNNPVTSQVLLPRLNGVQRDAASSIPALGLSRPQMNSTQSEVLHGLLRLVHDCPVVEIREDCAKIVDLLKNSGVDVPKPFKLEASSFIAESEVADVESTTAILESAPPTTPTASLFADLFMRTGRLDRFVRVMAMHPSYLDAFVKAHVYLMLSDQGPLPLNYRFYIGIMAASRHHCCYLVHKLILEYTLHGGDPGWLKGLGYAPPKLRSLSLINKLMAHRPWTIDRRHIEMLTKGSDPWSVSELFHALVILAHFHSLSTFVYGCGINPELDHPEAALSSSPTASPSATPCEECGNCPRSSSSPKSPSPRSSTGVFGSEMSSAPSMTTGSNGLGPADNHSNSSNGSQKMSPSSGLPPVRGSNGDNGMKAHRSCSGRLPSGASSGDQELLQVVLERMRELTDASLNDEELNQDDVVSKFQEVEAAAADLQPPLSGPLSMGIGRCPIVLRFLSTSTNGANTTTTNANSGSPTDDSSPTTYIDFCSRRGSGNQQVDSIQAYSPLKAQDFSWQECACSLANRLYPDVGDVFDEKLRVIQNLTYKTFCDRDKVDTVLFRRAIWYYVHCLYGIRHDDFDYKHINQLLASKKFKTYLKTAACYPERITRDDFNGWLLDFKNSEKVHISLMIAEARLESELIYVLRAFNAFLMMP